MRGEGGGGGRGRGTERRQIINWLFLAIIWPLMNYFKYIMINHTWSSAVVEPYYMAPPSIDDLPASLLEPGDHAQGRARAHVVSWFIQPTTTHATELVLDRPGFSETFDLLDSSKWSRRWVKCFKHFKIEFESNTQNYLNGGQWSWFCLGICYSCTTSS